jgi:lipopolysaccharide transport system ATP-binding protein
VGESRIGVGGAELIDVELVDAQGCSVQTVKCGERTIVRSTIQFHEDIAFPISGFKIKTLNGIAVVGNSTYGTPQSLPPMAAGTILTLEFAWNCYLAPGNYTVTVGVSETRADQKIVALDRRRDILPLTVIGSMSSYGLLALPVDIEYSCTSEIKTEIKTLQTTK